VKTSRIQNILYVGTEFACYVSINRGKDWTKLNSNLPTVAVHDFAQHPTTGELIAATHGRSLWALDVTPIRQLTQATMAAAAHLYKPNAVTVLRNLPARGISGVRHFRSQDPASVAQIFYSLGSGANEVTLTVTEADGTLLQELKVPSTAPGFHTVAWDLRRTTVPRPGAGAARGGGGGGGSPRWRWWGGRRRVRRPRRSTGGGGAAGQGGAGGGAGGGRGGFGFRLPPGTYKVVLTVDGQKQTQDVAITTDPDFPNFGVAAENAWTDEVEAEFEAQKKADKEASQSEPVHID
jgi:hypothetical protein